jgi:hypothetical protein
MTIPTVTEITTYRPADRDDFIASPIRPPKPKPKPAA